MALKRFLLAWHFVQPDWTVARLGVKAVPGLRLEHPGEVEPCSSGLHASLEPLDAAEYSNSAILCRVRCSGRIVYDGNKFACSVREIVAVEDVSDVLHRFACRVASDALDAQEKRGRKVDPRSRAAIHAKLDWIAGTISDAALAAAWAAAWDAAWDAARAAARAAAWAAAWAAAGAAAWDAAWAAAWDAAWDAARAAARAAAWAAARDAARAAAWAAAIKDSNAVLSSMLLEKLGLSKKPRAGAVRS